MTEGRRRDGSAGLLRAALLSATLYGTACTSASHTIQSEHLAPEWGETPFQNILVIGVYDDRPFRISSESVFASELTEKAVAASHSYDLIPDLTVLDDSASVRYALAGTDYDAILSVVTMEAGPDFDYGAWQTQYSLLRLFGSEGTFTRLGGAVDYANAGSFVLDIGLWDTRTLGSVWNATTDSYSLENQTAMVTDLADFMIAPLQERGLIAGE